MSKEEFEILKSLLEKLITVLSKNDSYASLSYWIPLIAAIFGAVSVLIPQSILQKSKSKKEKETKMKELLGEAYRTSFLLTESYKELVMHKVHKQFWFKCTTFLADQKDRDIYYERHHESNINSFKTQSEIRKSLAEYIKVVKSFEILSNDNEQINELLKTIRDFKPRKAYDFDGVQHEEIHAASEQEEKDLNNEYKKYGDWFDQINAILQRELQSYL